MMIAKFQDDEELNSSVELEVESIVSDQDNEPIIVEEPKPDADKVDDDVNAKPFIIERKEQEVKEEEKNEKVEEQSSLVAEIEDVPDKVLEESREISNKT